MDAKDATQHWAELLRRIGGQAGRTVARVAGPAARRTGQALLDHAGAAALRRGLVDRTLSLDEALEGIKVLYRRGGLTREEFQELARRLREAARGRTGPGSPDGRDGQGPNGAGGG
ncbi:MAG: hypothetical protein H0S85_03280 [Desulfovibrionaceae bacterium]|jgi:hypothetical protein|nr:hypothetical protein [Desulfovibrionaceae bacterium]